MGRLRLRVTSMGCRHCVREVTRWLRDVPGVETIAADAGTRTVVVNGTMTAVDVLAMLAGSSYTAVVLDDSSDDSTAAASVQGSGAPRASSTRRAQ